MAVRSNTERLVTIDDAVHVAVFDWNVPLTAGSNWDERCHWHGWRCHRAGSGAAMSKVVSRVVSPRYMGGFEIKGIEK